MTIQLLINGIDRTDRIIWNTLQKSDEINNKVDTLRFSVKKYGTQTYAPHANDTVELLDDGVTIFKGIILTVKKSLEGHSVIRYDIDSADGTHFLKRILVAESYADTTVGACLEDIISKYLPGYTLNENLVELLTEAGDIITVESGALLLYEGSLTASEIDLAIPITSILFNRISVADAIDKLARLTGYSWYVDYENNIHFFQKNTEPSPFDLTDTSENYIFETLSAADDISQLRNRVFVQGGEESGEARSERHSGNGDKKIFALKNKFASLPAVTVGGAAQTVGVSGFDEPENFDALWSYQEKTLTFTNAPTSGTNNVVASGIPLFTVIVEVEDQDSITEYGAAEFARVDATIQSREEARNFAVAELEAYAAKIAEGSFETYEAGLRSGQIISINSPLRDINESFLIQKVTFQMVSQNIGIYRVELATLRTVTLIDVLINQIRQSGIISETGAEVLPLIKNQYEKINFTESFGFSLSHNPQTEAVNFAETFVAQALDYPVEAVLGDQIPSGYKRQFILDGSRLQ